MTKLIINPVVIEDYTWLEVFNPSENFLYIKSVEINDTLILEPFAINTHTSPFMPAPGFKFVIELGQKKREYIGISKFGIGLNQEARYKITYGDGAGKEQVIKGSIIGLTEKTQSPVMFKLNLG